MAKLIPVFIGAAVVAGGFLLVDGVVATNTERVISTELQSLEGLPQKPAVTISGTPFIVSALGGEIDSLRAEMVDVQEPGFGLVNKKSEAFDLTVPPGQILSGNLKDATAKRLVYTVRLDGVALGEQLGISDLDISNPDDISPSASPSAEALLTGTPPGATEKQQSLVKLRIVDGVVHLIPTDQNDAFSWSVTSENLPLEGQASRVFCGGGSIYIESEQRDVRFDTEDLSSDV